MFNPFFNLLKCLVTWIVFVYENTALLNIPLKKKHWPKNHFCNVFSFTRESTETNKNLVEKYDVEKYLLIWYLYFKI